MRSGTGTKFGEPSLVTFSTKVTMAFFGAVSFQEGSGSAARETVVVSAIAQRSATPNISFPVHVIFTVVSFSVGCYWLLRPPSCDGERNR